jgi:alcohol dehydrogenase class IV
MNVRSGPGCSSTPSRRSAGIATCRLARDVGIARSDLKKLAEDAMKQTRLLVNNPREVSFDDALAIYTEAFGNRAAA